MTGSKDAEVSSRKLTNSATGYTDGEMWDCGEGVAGLRDGEVQLLKEVVVEVVVGAGTTATVAGAELGRILASPRWGKM